VKYFANRLLRFSGRAGRPDPGCPAAPSSTRSVSLPRPAGRRVSWGEACPPTFPCASTSFVKCDSPTHPRCLRMGQGGGCFRSKGGVGCDYTKKVYARVKVGQRPLALTSPSPCRELGPGHFGGASSGKNSRQEGQRPSLCIWLIIPSKKAGHIKSNRPKRPLSRGQNSLKQAGFNGSGREGRRHRGGATSTLRIEIIPALTLVAAQALSIPNSALTIQI